MPEHSTLLSSNRLIWAGALLLVVLLLAIYGPGFGNSLIFDDARLTDGVITGHYGSLLKLQPRMLSYASLAWQQVGSGDSLAAMRVVNLLLHAGACVLLYLFLCELMGTVRDPLDEYGNTPRARASALPALVATALFAVNPVAVYGVAYLVQRSIVMATLFSLLALWAFVRGVRQRQFGWIALAVVSYLLALMAKEQAIMVAAVGLPIYIFIARPPWKRVFQMGAVALIVLIGVTWLLSLRYGSIIGSTAFDQTSRAFMQQLEAQRAGITAQAYALSIINEAWLFFRYGALWLAPNVQWLSIDLRPPFPLTLTALPQVLGAAAFLLLTAISSWLLVTRRDALGLAATLVLCAQLLYATEFVTTWVQDPFVLYRSYLWAPMLFGVVALLLRSLPPKATAALGLILALILSPLAWERVQSMRNDHTVWSDAADKIRLDAPVNAVGRWRPFVNRGAYFLELEAAQSALENFNMAVRLGEPLGSAQMNRAVALQMLSEHAQALSALDAAEAAGFDEAALHYHRAVSLMRLQRPQEAYDSYTQALKRKQIPQAQQKTRVERVQLAMGLQRYDDAIKDLKELRETRPDNIQYAIGIGVAQVRSGQPSQAVETFRAILEKNRSAPAHYGLATALAALGQLTEALGQLDQAIQIDPQNPGYQQLRQQLQTAAPPAGPPFRAATPQPARP